MKALSSISGDDEKRRFVANDIVVRKVQQIVRYLVTNGLNWICVIYGMDVAKEQLRNAGLSNPSFGDSGTSRSAWLLQPHLASRPVGYFSCQQSPVVRSRRSNRIVEDQIHARFNISYLYHMMAH
jgi:hypothetical protein